MRKVHVVVAAALAAVVSSCGAGTPASVADVEELMKKELSEDDYTVTWVGVEPAAEPGEFKVIVDRRKGEDAATEQTMLCNVSATSNSNSRTCQTAEPSIMNQAADMLVKQYEERQLEVRNYTLKRTGEGNKFAGSFLIADPASGEQLEVPCTGDQNGQKFDISCEQEGAEAAPEASEA